MRIPNSDKSGKFVKLMGGYVAVKGDEFAGEPRYVFVEDEDGNGRFEECKPNSN